MNADGSRVHSSPSPVDTGSEPGKFAGGVRDGEEAAFTLIWPVCSHICPGTIASLLPRYPYAYAAMRFRGLFMDCVIPGGNWSRCFSDCGLDSSSLPYSVPTSSQPPQRIIRDCNQKVKSRGVC